MTFVNMERIEKRFNNQSVLRDVSLKMNRGEIVSIIGPSGSGKSTFLRCLGQLETIDGGSITVDGTVLASTENGVVKYASPQTQHELLLRMGMVFQSFNLFPHMTVLDNIMIAPRMVKGMKDDEISPIAEQLLNKVGLWEKRNMYPSRLSGGQQQRVAIARALAMNDILRITKSIVQRDFDISAFLVAAIFYLIFTFILTNIFNYLERRFAVYED